MELSEERAIWVIESLTRIESRLEAGDTAIREAKTTKLRVDRHLTWHRAVRWTLGVGGTIITTVVTWWFRYYR